MRKCADMKYHFAAKVRIYPSSQQKHIIAVNDGASRFVYNRMTANDRELHSLKKAASLCPAYKGKIAYLEQVRSSKRELVNSIPFLKEKDVDSLAVDNAIKNHNRAWERFREVPGTGLPGFHKKSYAQSYQLSAPITKRALRAGKKGMCTSCAGAPANRCRILYPSRYWGPSVSAVPGRCWPCSLRIK